jgi:hypothetical protein
VEGEEEAMGRPPAAEWLLPLCREAGMRKPEDEEEGKEGGALPPPLEMKAEWSLRARGPLALVLIGPVTRRRRTRSGLTWVEARLRRAGEREREASRAGGRTLSTATASLVFRWLGEGRGWGPGAGR